MKIYLVGGAVRDKLLNLPIKERDWVVIGADPEILLQKGFKPVGKSFPVFLHPDTGEEYALARTERKVGKGYKGFTFYAAPDVTLEQDLMRRDFTINAIAEDESGALIDPYNGKEDINKKLLRHVSDAFQEDPVRILRAARFSAKLPEFTLDKTTLKLMQKMHAAGEVDALVPERVCAELLGSLRMPQPTRFFEVLRDAHALDTLFPEIKFDSSGFLKLSSLQGSVVDPLLRWGILLHDQPTDAIKALCHRYRLPNEFTQLATLVSEHLPEFVTHKEAQAILTLLKRTDALRRGERFLQFLTVCTLCTNNQAAETQLKAALTVVKKVDSQAIVQSGVAGAAFGKALQKKQLEAIQNIL